MNRRRERELKLNELGFNNSRDRYTVFMSREELKARGYISETPKGFGKTHPTCR